MSLFFLDFEASSLSEASFPIEVGWCGEDGQGESHLICPPPHWPVPGSWDPASEAVHGIALDTLMREGEPVDVVARRVWEALGSEHDVVACDAPIYDGRWLARLLGAGAVQRGIRLMDTYDVITHAISPLATMRLPNKSDMDVGALKRMALDLVEEAELAEQQRPGVRHRALPDAQRHWRTWRTVTERVEHWTTPGTLLDYGVTPRKPRS